jgi:hypothetical protein
MRQLVNANDASEVYRRVAATIAAVNPEPKECIMRKTEKTTASLIDLGNALTQTKGLAQEGRPDTVQGQKFAIPGLARD